MSPLPIQLVKAPRRPAWPRTSIIIVAVFAAAAIGVTILSQAMNEQMITCLFKRVSHLPCPACGGSRTALWALEGQWGLAIACNPLIFIGLGVAAALIALRVLGGRRLVLLITGRQKRILLIGLAVAAAANWAYLLCMGR